MVIFGGGKASKMAICRGPQHGERTELAQEYFQVAAKSTMSRFQKVGTHVLYCMFLVQWYLWTDGLAKLGPPCDCGQSFSPGNENWEKLNVEIVLNKDPNSDLHKAC